MVFFWLVRDYLTITFLKSNWEVHNKHITAEGNWLTTKEKHKKILAVSNFCINESDPLSKEDRSSFNGQSKNTHKEHINIISFKICSTHMASALVRHRPWRGRIHANELHVNTKWLQESGSKWTILCESLSPAAIEQVACTGSVSVPCSNATTGEVNLQIEHLLHNVHL